MSATTEAGTQDPEIERLAGAARAILEGQTDLATIQGIGTKELDAVYALAHGFYGSASYGEALALFQFLTLHRPTEARFWFGLGATQQMLGQHALAVKSYGFCSLLDVSNAQVPLRAGECFLAIGDKANARSALEAAVTVAGANPKYAPHAARARLILESLGAEGTA